MVGGGAGLENRLGFEKPGRGRIDPPRGMRSKDRRGLREVIAVVGAKIKASPLPRPSRQRIEKRRLKQAVFVMASLGPRIGEKNDDRTETGIGGQRGEKIVRLGMKKVEIGQFRSVALADGTGDPLAHKIDANAQFAGMCRRAGREKMPVAAADFTQKARGGRQHGRQRCAQVGTALRDEREMGGAGCNGFHGGNIER